MAKKTKKPKKVSRQFGLIVLVCMTVLCATIVLVWILAKEVYLAENKSVRENAENIVVNNVNAPSDLVNTLLAEKSGCVDLMGRKNVSYIVRFNDDFALTQYGCALDAKMFYKKIDGEWKSLSPTNNFINGQPLCSHLEQYSIPADFVALCYDTPGDNGQLPAIIANSVK